MIVPYSVIYPIIVLFPITSVFPYSTPPWLSPIFNSHSFSLITTTNLSSIQDSTSSCPSFDKVKVYTFTNNGNSILLTSNHAIFDPTYPVSEPNFHSSDGIFDGWFGIPFFTDNSLTHIRASHPTEILALYRLDTLILLYPTIIFYSNSIVSLVYNYFSCYEASCNHIRI